MITGGCTLAAFALGTFGLPERELVGWRCVIGLSRPPADQGMVPGGNSPRGFHGPMAPAPRHPASSQPNRFPPGQSPCCPANHCLAHQLFLRNLFPAPPGQQCARYWTPPKSFCFPLMSPKDTHPFVCAGLTSIGRHSAVALLACVPRGDGLGGNINWMKPSYCILYVKRTPEVWRYPPPPPDDRILGTDQAVRGGLHGQKLHSGFPPRKVDACGSADARSSADACLS